MTVFPRCLGVPSVTPNIDVTFLTGHDTLHDPKAVSEVSSTPQTQGSRLRLAAPLAAALMAMTLVACSSSETDDSGSANSTSDSAVSAEVAAAVEAAYVGTNENPPTSGPTPLKDVNLWVVSCSAQVVGCQSAAEGAIAAGKLLGWDVTVADGNFNIADGYGSAMRQAIAAKANAIVLVGMDCNQAAGGMQAAADAGIPVIGDYSFDCKSGAKFTDTVKMTSKYPEISDWLKAWGAAKADWLIQATNAKAQVIHSLATDSPTLYLPEQGFEAELAAKCPDCKIVETISYSNQDLTSGAYKQKFSAALVAHPEANAVAVSLDALLLAGNIPAAIASTGRKMTVVGGEGLPPVVEMVKAGAVGAEVGFDTPWQGYAIVDTVNRVLQGEPSVPQGIGWQIFDAKRNLPTNPAGYTTSVDYVSGYKKLWGVS